MNNKTVELLAPAGDFACFMAAVNAGADAVYLGGMKFGARAYAGNLWKKNIFDSQYTCKRKGNAGACTIYGVFV